MSHRQQMIFVEDVLDQVKETMGPVRVLEVGSFDVNGSIRKTTSERVETLEYVGADLSEGPGVDVVCGGQELEYPDDYFDISISCECFEHNPYWVKTFENMQRMTRPGGMVIMTCATTGRGEHGTTRTRPSSSPPSLSVGWDYYLNLTERDFSRELPLRQMFGSHRFLVEPYHSDLYFVGFKVGAAPIAELPRDFETVLKQRIEAVNAEERASRPRSLGRFVFVDLPLRLFQLFPDRIYQNLRYHYLKTYRRARARS